MTHRNDSAADGTVTLLGIDVGGTHIKWAAVDATGAVIGSGQVDTDRTGGDRIVDQIVDVVQAHGHGAAALGLAVPGTVRGDTRETLVMPNIPGDWLNYPLAALVEDRVRKPVVILNDARAFGYAELHTGAGRGYDNVLFLTIGTGIGGAIARDGKLVIRDLDSLPELGHLVAEIPGEPCGCGARGCLETVASASAMIARAARAVLTGQSAILTELCGGTVRTLTAAAIAQAARRGDVWALDTLEHAGTALGTAVVNSCIALGSQAIVIGGGVAGAFEYLAPAIERPIRDRAWLLGNVDLLRAQHGSSAGAIGAALHAADRCGFTSSARQDTEKETR